MPSISFPPRLPFHVLPLLLSPESPSKRSLRFGGYPPYDERKGGLRPRSILLLLVSHTYCFPLSLYQSKEEEEEEDLILNDWNEGGEGDI